MTAVTVDGRFLQRSCIRDVVHGELALDQPAVHGGAAPGVQMRGREVLLERGVVGPQFAHADEAGVERVDGDVVGNAAVEFTGGIDERLEVGEHLGNALGWEAEGAEDGDGGGHDLASESSC